jgi:tight adherence protein B
MMLTAAYLLAFSCAALLVYAGLTGFYPQLRSIIASNYLEVDQTLKGIFYTNYDAKLFIGLRYGGSLLAFLVGFLLFDSLIFGLFMASLAYWIPKLLVERIVRHRKDALEQQTSQVMTALTSCIRSGMTLEESIGEIASKMRPPVSQEFSLIRDRIDAGQTIVSALHAADRRLQLPRLSLIFQSIIVSQERGGRLASLMDQLSESTREIERVEERVKTETSGLILSSRIMVCMPVVICGLLYFADPAQVTMLFNTPVGNVILVTAIGLNVVAFRMMQKIVDLDT